MGRSLHSVFPLVEFFALKCTALKREISLSETKLKFGMELSILAVTMEHVRIM